MAECVKNGVVFVEDGRDKADTLFTLHLSLSLVTDRGPSSISAMAGVKLHGFLLGLDVIS